MEFVRSRIKCKPLGTRCSDLDLSAILAVKKISPIPPSMLRVAQQIRKSLERKAAIILMMGGHVIRSGVQRYIIDLMERGFISCIAMNGAGIIHDYEYALIGATTESVAKYVDEGQFGL